MCQFCEKLLTNGRTNEQTNTGEIIVPSGETDMSKKPKLKAKKPAKLNTQKNLCQKTKSNVDKQDWACPV